MRFRFTIGMRNRELRLGLEDRDWDERRLQLKQGYRLEIPFELLMIDPLIELLVIRGLLHLSEQLEQQPRLGMPSKKKNSKIWDIGPKGGRGSSLNPKFFSYFNWDKYCRREGSKGLCHKKNAINFCSLCSSFMYFRMI